MTGARDKTHETREADAWYTIDPRVIPALLQHFHPPQRGLIWECAAGKGHMVRALLGAGYRVISSDITAHEDCDASLLNFLEATEAPLGATAIVTNPPNKANIDFARKAIELMEPVRGMVALYQRHEWDATVETSGIFDHPAYAFKITCRFRPRWVEPVPGKKKASPFHRWSWFCWDWSSVGIPPMQRFAYVAPPSRAKKSAGPREAAE